MQSEKKKIGNQFFRRHFLLFDRVLANIKPISIFLTNEVNDELIVVEDTILLAGDFYIGSSYSSDWICTRYVSTLSLLVVLARIHLKLITRGSHGGRPISGSSTALIVKNTAKVLQK